MERKKRKWDVAAPAAAGATGTAPMPGRAGIGTGAAIPAQFAGFVTGQVTNSGWYSSTCCRNACLKGRQRGEPSCTCLYPQGLVQQQQPAALPVPAVAKSDFKPGQPLGSDIIARAQAGAALAMEKINKVHPAVHGIGAGDMLSACQR